MEAPEKLNQSPEDEPESIERRAPICGLLSLTTPFASLAVGYVADKTFRLLYPNDHGWLSGVAFVALPIMACFFGGMILAIIAVLRNEKWRAVPLIGLLLNFMPWLISIFW